MKIRIPVCVAAGLGLFSVALSQETASSADERSISPELLALQQATALAGEDRFEEAWQLLTSTPARGGTGGVVSPGKLGWRVAAVAGALRNRSDYAEADAFARFALAQPWTAVGETLSKKDTGDAGYWCAWLASEILTDRVSALAWIDEAAKADAESDRVRELREKLEAAERSFPTR